MNQDNIFLNIIKTEIIIFPLIPILIVKPVSVFFLKDIQINSMELIIHKMIYPKLFQYVMMAL